MLRAAIAEQRGPTTGLVLGSFAAGIAESAILALVAHVATAMVDGAHEVTVEIGPAAVTARLPVMLGVAGAIAALRLLLQLAMAYLPARMGADSQAALRHRVFDAYSRASWDVQSEEREGHLQELLSNQVGEATRALLMIANLVSSGLVFLTLVITAFLLGPLVAVVVVVVAGSLFAVLRPIGTRGRRFATDLSKAQIAYAESVGTSVRLAEETYAFGVADSDRARLRDRAENARRHFLRTQFASRLTQGIYQGLVILLLVGGLAGLYASGTGRIASLGTVVLILVRASTYGQQAQVAWQVVEQAGPYLDRLAQAERRYLDHPQPAGRALVPVGGEIRLDKVAFGYRADRPVLEGLSLSIAAGEAIGVVGPSGAGKSTLVQLLLAMRTPTSGRILVGDIPLEEISLQAWHEYVAYVPQEPRLLQATVADNISFARDLDDASVERAARQAHIHDDIVAMPHGYDTIIGQRADAVSGGQRQRICIARALAGAPAVLVLDEPTSALDAASEISIRHTLTALRGDLTMVIIAHRPALLEICDRVVEIHPAGSAKAVGD